MTDLSEKILRAAGSGLRVGDYVEKVGGDYTFEGIVVMRGEKVSGEVRIVVEDDRGALHIYSEKNLRLAEPKPWAIESVKWVKERTT